MTPPFPTRRSSVLGWLMASAVAVERLSDHPLAVAIARDGEQFLDGQPVLAATDLSSLTGRGVQARVNGEMVLIGKAEMFGRDGFAALSAETVRTIERLRDQGRTTMAVRIGDRDLGHIRTERRRVGKGGGRTV